MYYTCTKCGNQRDVVYNIRYGMWGMYSWMCRFCARYEWFKIGRSPAADIQAKFYHDDSMAELLLIGLSDIPSNDYDELHPLEMRTLPEDVKLIRYSARP